MLFTTYIHNTYTGLKLVYSYSTTGGHLLFTVTEKYIYIITHDKKSSGNRLHTKIITHIKVNLTFLKLKKVKNKGKISKKYKMK